MPHHEHPLTARAHLTHPVAFLIAVISFGMGQPLQAGDAGDAFVPPSDEIVVVEPELDPLGKPRPIFVVDPATGEQTVTVPRTVILHRYYYTGDRSFQGPLLTGGPAMIVTQHPRTGEQITVDAVLQPGAPVIHYTRNGIVYQYEHTAQKLVFGHAGPRMVTHGRSGPLRNAVDRVRESAESTASLVRRTGLPEAAGTVKTELGNAAANGAENVRTLGQRLLQPGRAVKERTPLGGLFAAPPAEATRGISSEIERFVPTVR